MPIQTYSIPYQADPSVTFRQFADLPHLVWLDSGKPDAIERSSRFDIITAQPVQIISAASEATLKQMQHELEYRKEECDLPFCGGWLGVFNYECLHERFGLDTPTHKTCWFGWFEWAVIHDHQENTSVLVALGTCPPSLIDQIKNLIDAEPKTLGDYDCGDFQCDESESTYLKNVAKIKDYIVAGDCYQTNYTQRFSAAFKGDSKSAYLALRKSVPSPYCAYIDTGENQILSVSPERFINIDRTHAETHPIKGTSKRGQSVEEDALLKTQLQSSAKNRAENVMIVDLLRNDFGQHCLPNSVKVPSLFDIQTYENVHHLVSIVEGELPDDLGHIEFILSCFPGGSITGAPKKRAMEIIAELESHPRGPYCGSIGFFSVNRQTQFNIAIRTLETHGEKVYCWGGGGIVHESTPESEYEESHQKVRALMAALEKRN